MGKMTVNEQSAEEKAKEESGVQHKKAEAVAGILSSLDLPVTDAEKAENKKAEDAKVAEEERLLTTPEEKLSAEERSKRAVIEKSRASGQKGNKEEQITEDELVEIPDEELNDEGLKIKKAIIAKREAGDDDGDLVPKSKVEKRFKALTKEIRDLKAQLDKSTTEARKAEDQDMVKLEKKTIPELRTLKQTVKRKIRTEQDPDKLDALDELETKIDECILNAPQRFQQKQVGLYNAAVKEVLEDEGITDIEKATPEIRKIAQQIFATHPKLQRLEEGQAMALKFAVEHYKVVSKSSSGKEEVLGLKGRLNALKKKTTLDSSLLKRSRKSAILGKLKERAGAKRSTMLDKQAYIKADPRFGVDLFIPDEFKEQ